MDNETLEKLTKEIEEIRAQLYETRNDILTMVIAASHHDFNTIIERKRQLIKQQNDVNTLIIKREPR